MTMQEDKSDHPAEPIDDPFAVFEEWAEDADDEAYATL